MDLPPVVDKPYSLAMAPKLMGPELGRTMFLSYYINLFIHFLHRLHDETHEIPVGQ